jgi:hypothetical protein
MLGMWCGQARNAMEAGWHWGGQTGHVCDGGRLVMWRGHAGHVEEASWQCGVGRLGMSWRQAGPQGDKLAMYVVDAGW